MIHEITSPPHLARSTTGPSDRTLIAEPTWGLLRFLVILILISGITCVYLWQASTISVIRDDVASLREQLKAQERQNVALMLQLAQWNSPSYIEAEAKRQGLVPAPAPIHVQIAPRPVTGEREMGPHPNLAATTPWDQGMTWLARLANRSDRWPGLATAARIP